MTKSVDLETSRMSVRRIVILVGAIGDVGGVGGAVVAMMVRAGMVGLQKASQLINPAFS